MNHHGRVRTLGDEDENDADQGPQVLQNNWVGDSDQLKLDLVSRHEDVQVISKIIQNYTFWDFASTKYHSQPTKT